MPKYRPEPARAEGANTRAGVLLVNLGTPDAPTASALRSYLREFLSDPRIVELPRSVWWPILHGVILRTRPAKSAQKYARIWDKEGSPLAVHTQRQAKLLKGYLAQAGHNDLHIDYAMRYGQPSLAARLDSMKAAGCSRILLVPLYPQYAGSTTGSIGDALAAWMRESRALPELRLSRGFHDDPAYISALAAGIRRHWSQNGRAERLVMSFHGVPRSAIERGDPYHDECQETARLLAAALRLKPEEYLVSFQSRFGKAQWLQPYTQASLVKLAKAGVKSVDVICPGFTADCLETLEEISIECRADFLTAGGQTFNYIPCLNENPDWIRCLQQIVERQAADWLAAAPAQASKTSTS
ncbi:MAG: ferrochelatase [Betaproteobacteria bacterium]|nr:ferrochelatase [Betaproteobacteria bacterium]